MLESSATVIDDMSSKQLQSFTQSIESINYTLNVSQMFSTIINESSDSTDISWMYQTITARTNDNQSIGDSDYIDSYVVCHNRSHLAFTSIQQLSLQICMIASIVSFIIQLSVYGFVPKLQSLPGKCLMSLSLSLLATNLFLIMSYNVETSRDNITCVIIGIGKHYFVLVVFCWMSVLAFDTHWTFHLPNRNQFATTLKGYHKRTSLFIKYSVYSWLTPAVIVSIAVTIDFSVDSDLPLKPMYGEVVCGLSQLLSILVWGTIPCCVILFVNMIFFAKTLQKLNRITGETEIANKATFRERLLWSLKLAIFLGIAWIISFISSFVCEIWFQFFAQLFLSSQGLFILFITTLKKSVFELLKRRIFYLRNGGRIQRQQSSKRSFQASASMKTLPIF